MAYKKKTLIIRLFAKITWIYILLLCHIRKHFNKIKAEVIFAKSLSLVTLVIGFVSISIAVTSLTGCSKKEESNELPKQYDDNYGVYYEIFVGSFYDSDGDGMGDIRGIIEKLDYINDGKPDSKTSLHADGIWLMPIMPSPSYHKYDVTDYYDIDSDYGTMEDFEELITECDKRGIKVIIDLVVNHTSNMHPWFREAINELKEKKEPKYSKYYSFTSEKINSTYYFAGLESQYYEAVFYSGMPDLNYDSDEVREEMKQIANFWLEKGVAGFRLDAVKHIDIQREKSVEVLTWFVDYCKSVKEDVYIVGEVWSDDKEVMDYYESKIPSLFNFGFAEESGVIANAVNKNTGADFASSVIRWHKLLSSRNENGIDAPFLSNHDNNRSAGYFKEDVVKEKMAAALYLMMPGNPFIYYGEELGLTGKGIDENKRGPMIWTVDSEEGQAKGPSGMTQRAKLDEGVYEQLKSEDSLLRFYIEAVRLRNRYPEISRGTPTQIKLDDRSLAAYKVSFEESEVIILHNLSIEEKMVTFTDYDVKKIGGYLASAGGEPVFKNGEVTMPAYSTVVLELNSRQ